MSQAEAGYAIEPFNMKQERAEGHFDDDFNYAWKGEVDESKEADEKVAKRRKLIAAQIEQIGTQDEAAADVPALASKLVALLEPGESVSAALRRLGAEDRAARKQRAAAAAAATTAA